VKIHEKSSMVATSWYQEYSENKRKSLFRPWSPHHGTENTGEIHEKIAHEFPVNEWMKNFENKIKTLTEHHDSLPDEEVVRLGKKDPEAYPLYIDKFFQLYCGDQFYWWRKPEILEITTDLSHVTDNLYHIMLNTSP
jgi:hypothetical protein